MSGRWLCGLAHLCNLVDGGVTAEREAGAGNVVTDGGRDTGHRYTQLRVVGPRVTQLQQRQVRLEPADHQQSL